jgi:hypothetical protein
MEEESFEGVDGVSALAGPGPHIGNLPNVDLTVCNNVAAGAREVATDSLADSVYRLPDIDWRFIQIAKSVDADRDGKQ